MNHKLVLMTSLLTLAGCAPPAQQNIPSPQTLEIIARYAARQDIRSAMIAANARPAGGCKAANTKWLKEYPMPPGDGLIATLLANPLSQKLAKEAKQSGGQLVQLMVMDKAGCLIAAESKTHDLEQSDEPKYLETVGAQRHEPLYEGSVSGPLGPIDQMSQAIYNENGDAIGALTLRWCPIKGGCGEVPR